MSYLLSEYILFTLDLNNKVGVKSLSDVEALRLINCLAVTLNSQTGRLRRSTVTMFVLEVYSSPGSVCLKYLGEVYP